MNGKHVAFTVEPVYGHLVPTLGIGAELVRAGYRVSYAIKEQFAPRIAGIGAEAMIFRPLENKLKVFREEQAAGSCTERLIDRWKDLRQEETEDTLRQLKELYANNTPDVVIYDCMTPAGRLLAQSMGATAIEHSPLVISKDNPLWSYEGESLWTYDQRLVLVSIPKFFQRKAEDLDGRFQFIGFIQNDRKRFFAPWKPTQLGKKIILVSGTTGLLPQIKFFRTAIAAFRDFPYQIVLSIGDQIAPSSLEPLPANFEINRGCSNFEILESTCLFVGQAGQGSVLEALYCAVPQLLIPPPLPVFDDSAVRIAELGLGMRLQELDVTVDNVRAGATCLLQDSAMRNRVQVFANTMRASNGATMAARLINEYTSR